MILGEDVSVLEMRSHKLLALDSKFCHDRRRCMGRQRQPTRQLLPTSRTRLMRNDGSGHQYADWYTYVGFATESLGGQWHRASAKTCVVRGLEYSPIKWFSCRS